MMNNLLYHGSSHKISKLEPRPSKVIQNEKAVFATDSKDLAVIFIAKWSDCDIDVGYYHNKLYCCEQYPDAFDLLKKDGGYLYSVKSNDFISDERLGMQKHEFISKKSVEIEDTVVIENVYDYLVRSNMTMIKYEEKMDALYESGLFDQSISLIGGEHKINTKPVIIMFNGFG